MLKNPSGSREAVAYSPLVPRSAFANKSIDGWAAVEFAPLFSGILPQDYRRISATARVKEFARGEMLYLEGDTVEQVYLLTSGFVKITQLGPRGTEVILRLGVPGDVLGEVGLFSTGSHCTTAQALRLGYALVWEARVFKPLVETLPVLHQNMTRLTYNHLRELEERFRELATERVAPRVARQLVRLQEQIGRPSNGAIEIGLSREDLAQMTGTTLFTVSRLLSAWEARGLVNPRRESVTILDVQSLRNISEEIDAITTTGRSNQRQVSLRSSINSNLLSEKASSDASERLQNLFVAAADLSAVDPEDVDLAVETEGSSEQTRQGLLAALSEWERSPDTIDVHEEQLRNIRSGCAEASAVEEVGIDVSIPAAKQIRDVLYNAISDLSAKASIATRSGVQGYAPKKRLFE